jgi:hypothetical protein
MKRQRVKYVNQVGREFAAQRMQKRGAGEPSANRSEQRRKQKENHNDADQSSFDGLFNGRYEVVSCNVPFRCSFAPAKRGGRSEICAGFLRPGVVVFGMEQDKLVRGIEIEIDRYVVADDHILFGCVIYGGDGSSAIVTIPAASFAVVHYLLFAAAQTEVDSDFAIDLEMRRNARMARTDESPRTHQDADADEGRDDAEEYAQAHLIRFLGLSSSQERCPLTVRDDRNAAAATRGSYDGLRAEEDGFALEHFYGDEESGGGVDAGGSEDDGDVVPVIGAGD